MYSQFNHLYSSPKNRLLIVSFTIMVNRKASPMAHHRGSSINPNYESCMEFFHLTDDVVHIVRHVLSLWFLGFIDSKP
jgi:hypothetical protein